MSSSNETSFFDSLQTALSILPLDDILFSISWFTLFIISIIITLLYMYTFRQNRELEKKTAVYPILNHFNTVVKVTYFMLIALLSSVWFMTELKRSHDILPTYLWLLHFLSAVLFIYFLYLIPQVQYILHLMLASQRLLLYFVPSYEKYVNLSEKAMGRVIKALYVLIIIKDIWFFVRFYQDLEEMDRTRSLARFMATLIILQVISAIAYIPVIISIRKLTNLVSIEKYKPHKYIFYQMMASLIIRSPLVFLLVQAELQDELRIFYTFPFFDLVLTPISIQLAYLLCNRRNIQVLLSFSLKNMIGALMFPDFRPNQVGSEVVESTRY